MQATLPGSITSTNFDGYLVKTKSVFIMEKILNALSRVTSSQRYIPEIDGLRFYAIATVVLLHLGTHLKRNLNIDFRVPPTETWLDRITAQGALGVDVFFAISGFILALPFAQYYLYDKPKVNLRKYFIRRLTRLEPPYIITLVIFLFVQVMIIGMSLQAILPNFFASFFYLHNLIYGKMSIINPVAWSLEIEVQFYVLAPLIFFLFKIPDKWLRRSIMVGISLLMIALNVWFFEILDDWHLRKSLLAFFHLFLMGILFADFYLEYFYQKEIKHSYIYDILGFGMIVIQYSFRNYFIIPIDVIYTASIFFLFLATFKGVLFNAFFKNRIIAVIGGMCYSIYLLHYPLIALFVKFTSSIIVTDSYIINYFVQFLIIVPILLFVSSIFFVLIEKPCMKRDWHLDFARKIKNFIVKPA